MDLRKINAQIRLNRKKLNHLKSVNKRINELQTSQKILKILKKKELKKQEHKYVVLCGAQAHFDSWGNHDMTTSYADHPSGYGDIGYYARCHQVGFYDTFTIAFTAMHKHFSLKECESFNKPWLHRLYNWLAHKPLGDLLVKAAKRNTIQIK